MHALLEKLLESVLILVVFYLVYRVFLIRQASFTLNRFFLLLGILFSIFLPFVKLPATDIGQVEFYFRLKTIDIFSSGYQQDGFLASFLHVNSLGYVYFSGLIFFSLRLITQFIILVRLYLKASKVLASGDRKIVFTGKNHPAFSFMHSVFIGLEDENNKDLEIILNHEKVHIIQKHSLDLLLLELLAIVQWFNPLIWAYRKVVKQNHEYLADRGVVKAGIPGNKYQEVLLGNYKDLRLGFANSFNHSLTLKRLVMLKNSGSNKLSVFRLFIIIPLVSFSVYLISCANDVSMKDELKSTDTKVIKGMENESGDLLQPPPPPPPPTDKNISNAELSKMPEFPGGEKELINFLAKNTKYPPDAKENGIQGTVMVHFVITKEGKVEKAEILQSVSQAIDNEALRVVSSMPAWKPGRDKNGQAADAHLTIPIKFKLQ
jgi:TonB family protein